VKRRPRVRSALVVAALGLGLVSRDAGAETPPSVWDRARDPDAAAAHDLHERVQHRLIPTAVHEVNDAEIRTARAMLLEAHADTSRHVFLRFDLAHVYSALKEYARAAAILKSIIAEFPDDASLERAWERLANACGHIGDHACEREAYIHELRFETEEVSRAVPTLNLAETQMHLGELKDAIEGYREAIRIAARLSGLHREVPPLATWGLAVALDRAGDRLGAEKEARFALELQRSMGMPTLLRDPDVVYFFPEYEIHWYEGLGAAARARVASSSREASALWRQAERSFGEYVKAGEPKNDRWLPIAKARLAQAKAERERTEKAGAKEPPPSPATDHEIRL